MQHAIEAYYLPELAALRWLRQGRLGRLGRLHYPFPPVAAER
jgi:hypothetical protein